MLKASDLFDFPESLPFDQVFSAELAPWQWVPLIAHALKAFPFESLRGDIPPGLHVEGQVFIHPSVKLPSFGSITGPAYIGEGCELRPGVYIRGFVITGANCVLGNSCEFKNCLLLDDVQVPHFSYVGDSVLGNKVHLAAGVTCSNLRLDQSEVPVQLPDDSRCGSGLRKLGALVGDAAEVGCNSVLNPGSILGRRSLVMPSMAFRGYLKANSIASIKEKIETAPRID
ncbi:MAG TPA: UDP-N-acetylglucosamine diphosphorylase [Opitutae bacterium]|jgi:NDP-sugar pyrophosphorylase family protein|nr:UDP-N-acetylglucosamine diphosphorylase [Opitutae bacterium]